LLPLRSPFLGYFDKIIKPAALEAGLTAIKADDTYGTRNVIIDYPGTHLDFQSWLWPLLLTRPLITDW
jgi:hypothetical protein